MSDKTVRGKASALPAILDLAKEIRDGRTPQSICTEYGIARTTLNGRFRDAGFILETGRPHVAAHGRPEPLPAGHVGAGGQYVAGGDYQGLPTTPVRYRGKPRPNGIDWAAVDANYIANGGVIDPTIWPKTAGPVVTTDNNPRSRDAAHTHVEASHRGEPATPRPKRAPAPNLELKRNPPNIKITTEMRPEVGRRYQAGESLPELARAYDVSVTTIRNVLEAIDIPIRTMLEAGQLRRERRAS